MNVIELSGCTAEPLMAYLKALGVFRLVAEQADSMTLMCWYGGNCLLHTALDRDSLVDFFLERYQPSPIATPWNSASGFAPTKAANKAPKDKAARAAVEEILRSKVPQLDPYRNAISSIQQLPRGNEDEKNWKRDYFVRCRSGLPDSVVSWLDVCFALTDRITFPLPPPGIRWERRCYRFQ